MNGPDRDSLLSWALYYAGLGYKVFPCVPNQTGVNAKNPLTDRGLLDATTNEDVINAWWTRWRLANVAIVTEGLVVIDTDPGSVWPIPDLAEDLLPAPQAKTPRGGYHRYFKTPEGKAWRNTQSKLSPKVDTRANGGYVLAFPSFVDDKPYEWIQQVDCGPDELPLPPEWLILELDRIDRAAPKGNLAGAMADGEITETTVCGNGNPIPEGVRNSTLTSLAGTMRRVGMTEAELFAALQAVNVRRCRPPLEVLEIKKIAASIGSREPDQIAVAMVEGHYEQDRGIDIEAPHVSLTPYVPAEMPTDLLSIGGLIGDVAAYTNATSHRHQPDLAFAGALSLMAVLTGRKITDEQDTRTNIYSFGLAPSGGGKDRARQVNKAVLRVAGGLHLLGQESFASQQGLFTQVESKLAVLCQVDELGEFLRAIKNPKNAHLQGIISELLKLYSSANTVYFGPAHADATRDKSVDQPHMVFYGTTVSESFFDAMTIESVTGGFLSRSFFFEGPSDLKPKQNAGRLPVPQGIIDQVKAWVEFSPGGNLSTEFPQPLVLQTHEDAESIFRQADTECDERHNLLGSPLGTIWTRVVENARKLAILKACSDKGPTVGGIDGKTAEWAIAVAKNRAARMEHLAETRVSENEYDAMRKKLLKFIVEAGPRGISGREWGQKVKRYPPAKVEEALNSLLKEQDAIKLGTKPKLSGNGGGRPGYRLVGSQFGVSSDDFGSYADVHQTDEAKKHENT